MYACTCDNRIGRKIKYACVQETLPSGKCHLYLSQILVYICNLVSHKKYNLVSYIIKFICGNLAIHKTVSAITTLLMQCKYSMWADEQIRNIPNQW